MHSALSVEEQILNNKPTEKEASALVNLNLNLNNNLSIVTRFQNSVPTDNVRKALKNIRFCYLNTIMQCDLRNL